MTVAERFKVEYLEFNRISAARQVETLRQIAELESQLEDDGRTIGDVEARDFLTWASLLLGAGLHVNTVRKRQNMLRAFFSWAYTADVITADQYLKLKTVKNPRGSTGITKPKPYTKEEMETFWPMLDAKKPYLPTEGRGSQAIARWKSGKGPWARVWRHAFRLQLDCMIRLALDLGLRASEIYDMSVDDIHYDNDYFVVRGKADPMTGEPKVRKVPYTDECRRRVYAWLEFRALMNPDHDRPWLTCFAQWRNNPMPKDRFSSLLQDSIGKQWRWHRLRHTCATNWLRAGMELERVSALLGHANLQQTLCYVEIAKGDLAKSMAKHNTAFEEGIGRAA